VLCFRNSVSTTHFKHVLKETVTRRKNMGVHLSDRSFGEDSDRQADYSDFLRRFQEDPQSISTEEAARRYQELVSHAPPELAAETNRQIMGLLPQNDREVLADNISGSPQNIGLLDNILGKDSFLNTPLGKMILSAAVAYLANRMLGQQQGQVGAPAPSGGLGDLIGSILGGAAGGQPAGRQAPTGGLEDILGALSGQGAPTRRAPAGGLEDILGALAGEQAQRGGGQSGGLADLLSGLLQGDTPASAPEPPEPEPAPEPKPRARSHRKR
jgi:hypothetical protein